MTKLAKSSFQGIRAHVAGSYRAETLHGKEYIVVPVVALVEGVLQGMSSSGPELALAEEFGKFPDSWNGRPVVMSHPVVDGSPVSANSPSTLETYQIGFIFNTTLDGKKLIQEAWIDVNMAATQGDDAKEILEALEKGEMIEVSTGYYAMIEPSVGMHNNKKYQAIQRSVTPDHLAFLPVGTLGACSNADGCGAQLAANSSKDKEFMPVLDFRVDNVPCCSSCAETGGSCTHDHRTSKMPEANSTSETSQTPETKGDPKKYDPTTIANTIAGGVLISDAREAVSDAIKASGVVYGYVLGMTTDKVIYESYNNFTGAYDKYQRSYKVSVDGKVTLSDDIEKVRLMTKVVTVNADGADATGEGESSMTDATKPGGTAPVANTDEKKPTTQTVENEQGTLEVTFDANGKTTGFKLTPKVNAAPKVPQTTEEFIAQAPKEMQEVLKSSLQLHEDSKKAIIAQIKGTNRCKISDERLTAMSLQDLQEIAELANVPSFEGRALPNTNTRQEDLTFTPAPNVFEFGAPKADKDAA